MKTIVKLFHKFKIIQETSSEIDWYQVVKVRISHTRAGSKTSRGLPSSGEFVSGTKFDNYLRTRFCRHIWRVLSFFSCEMFEKYRFRAEPSRGPKADDGKERFDLSMYRFSLKLEKHFNFDSSFPMISE